MAERLHFGYANIQKVPFLCFSCRLAVKHNLSGYLVEYSDIPRLEQRPYSEFRCPQCHQPMAFLGRYFKVPPRAAIKEWRKVEMLWKKRWTADGYSLGPKTLREAKEYEKDLERHNRKLRLERIRAQNEEKWRSVRGKRRY